MRIIIQLAEGTTLERAAEIAQAVEDREPEATDQWGVFEADQTVPAEEG